MRYYVVGQAYKRVAAPAKALANDCALASASARGHGMTKDDSSTKAGKKKNNK